MQKLIVILGSTAIGKTKLAVHLAEKLNGEIISADSRQVYRNMDIGTGKDLAEYQINEKSIPYHLIDTLDAGEKYDVFRFQEDFHRVLNDIRRRGKQAILCGGTGLYLQAALQSEKMLAVPRNEVLREKLENYSQEELVHELKQIKDKLHNQSDTKDRERTIRAIEIATYENENLDKVVHFEPLSSLLFGVRAERSILRERIKLRLDSRLEEGMIAEVENLLKGGLTLERLTYYGLEYKFIGEYLDGQYGYEQMYKMLLQGIRRFAKKQETWFRRMEKMGQKVHWLEWDLPLEEKIKRIEAQLNEGI